ncbi:PH-domain-containing protein [Backusella circina FSU 941]|nr:PH-domain-containing protein [Backusella circina FSU 941]
MSLVFPASGWLKKKIYLPLGGSRWALRYFILLDSELRFYKDEYTSSPSHILDMKQVDQIIPIPTTHRPYCFRIDRLKNKKSWVLDCNSQSDLEAWILALKKRLDRIAKTTCSESITTSPQVYREPTLPLRCVNLDQEAVTKASSLLSRRNKYLAPIRTDLYERPSTLSASTISSTHSSPIVPLSSLDLPQCHCKPGNISIENYSPTYMTYKRKFHI